MAALEAYRSDLKIKHARGEALEQELFAVAERLSSPRSRVDQASFDEKRRAVVELVKGIEITTETIDKKRVAVVTITYRFDQPDSHAELGRAWHALVANGTAMKPKQGSDR